MNVECTHVALDGMTSAFKFNDAVIRHLVIRRDSAATDPSPLVKSKEKDGKDERGGRGRRRESGDRQSAAPVETAAAPVETAAAPVETAAAPVETAAAPVETAAAPVETAAAAKPGEAGGPGASDGEPSAESSEAGEPTDRSREAAQD